MLLATADSKKFYNFSLFLWLHVVECVFPWAIYPTCQKLFKKFDDCKTCLDLLDGWVVLREYDQVVVPHVGYVLYGGFYLPHSKALADVRFAYAGSEPRFHACQIYARHGKLTFLFLRQVLIQFGFLADHIPPIKHNALFFYLLFLLFYQIYVFLWDVLPLHSKKCERF